ncbi:hypothetical protein [Klenkia sp. PcliD-1-E]|uniref:hypothetical protein n=1 Tax=Klenkia sp. PcliD-1-E TaxID=2954492 RepID=UPI002097CF86|nr:hypothetical protein [Klenkia sp. PcliD-1-E]MCO7221298.1 hypothetical protein [Klenkia sp. PcliD-1-E]
MTSRARLSRRPLQVGGLLLATAALGTVTAPAASAMVDPTAPVDETTEQAPDPAPVVLTNSPASYLGTPEEPVDFGMGKLQIRVAPEPGVDAPEEEDMSGAVVEVTFAFDDGPTVLTCTTDVTGLCTFEDTGLWTPTGQPTLLRIDPDDTFTVQQVQPPSSQRFDLPTAPDDTVYGAGSYVDVFPDLEGPLEFAPSTAPAAGAPWNNPGTIGSIVFYDPLVQLSGSQPGDPSTAPGAPASDPAAAAPPVVPVVPSAATPAATAAPTLATTGFDAVPAALVGGGLLAAGAGAVALGRRRAAR